VEARGGVERQQLRDGVRLGAAEYVVNMIRRLVSLKISMSISDW
jgi:hypothetical protein